ncbi:DUF4157 domain-containing protein [Nostoc sp. C052]|uniref:eCIS core domain-containing protein n=1 Tax=Nostoc sp. C052 TaxID=2576902 RepID=UPI0018EFA744|nr:DUF4157 domain-containing protein [Nostoc sp. C052]
MKFPKIHLSTPSNPKTPENNSALAPKLSSIPSANATGGHKSTQEIEDKAFAEKQMEATELKLQAKFGSITPEGQERLNVLQAKMDGLLNSRLEHATRFSHNIANISLRRPDTPTSIQAKLTIGETGDKYEQEADETASQVVQRIHQPQSEKLQRERESLPEEEKLQIKPEGSVQRESLPEGEEELQMKPEGSIQRESLPAEEEELQMKPMMQGASDRGIPASSDLETSIQQARGSGQPLADSIKSPMEQAFGADFSRVKVHTDTQADQLNQSIQAKAFTTGHDVFFRQGEYQPGSRGGQELLAHELTHVLQQNSDTVQCRIIQRAVDTMGGSWEANNYQSVLENGNPGAEIELEFMPNKLVNSKKIALLQKIEKTHNGINLDRGYADKKNNNEEFFGNATKTAASRTQGNGHWDRGLTYTNPVYGAPNLKTGEPVSKTPKSKLDMNSTTSPDKMSNYQLGHRYRLFPGLKWNERSAKLYDKPNMPTATIGSNMIFETTAISLEGAQKNVYYGSVKWGWNINSIADSNGKVATTDIELEPLAVVEIGTPSAEMKDLANTWNQADTYTRDAPEGIPNTGIPTTNHSTTLTLQELQDPARIQQEINNLLAQLKLNQPKNDKQNKQFELKFLKKKLQELK